MLRALMWANVTAWSALSVWAAVDRPIFAVPCALLAAANLAALFPDVLADHPDEEEQRRRDLADRLEDRRRRGLAGWEKPVKPARDAVYPGGLPPKPRG